MKDKTNSRDASASKKSLIKREEKNKTLMKRLQKEWPQYQELKNCMSKLFIQNTKP